MPGAMQPSRSDVHVNRPMTAISVAFMQEQSDFVALRAFPSIPVQKESDRYFVYKREDWYRNQMKKRAPSTESSGGGWNVDSTPSYSADEYALHKDVDDRVRNNADQPLDMDRDATEFLSQQALINMDDLWVAAFMKTSVWGTDVTPGTLWSAASSTPIKDIRTGKRTVKGKTGKMPNVLVLSRDTFDVLCDHPDVVGRFDRGQTQGVATANEQTLAALFGLEEVLVCDGVKNSAVQGATESTAFLSTKDALLLYRENNPGILKPSAGYTFAVTSQNGAGANGQRIFKFRMDERKSDRLEIEQFFAQKLVASELGYFFENAIA